jgi:hypothetical protein
MGEAEKRVSSDLAYQRERRAIRRAMGLCRECPAMAIPGKTLCNVHNQRWAVNHARMRAADVAERPIKSCANCGKVIGKDYKPKGGKPSQYCSDACNGAVQGAKRRARMRSLPTENISPLKVLARDGWRCQLCGIRTPKGLRGTRAPNAPEMDHIIPLAAGGSHTWDNVQCACKRCNNKKHAKPLGQLRIPA